MSQQQESGPALGPLVASAVVVAVFGAALAFKRDFMLRPSTLLFLNLLSLAIFEAFMFESPEYGTDDDFFFLEKLGIHVSNRRIGALTLGALVVFYLYTNVSLTRQLRSGG